MKIRLHDDKLYYEKEGTSRQLNLDEAGDYQLLHIWLKDTAVLTDTTDLDIIRCAVSTMRKMGGEYARHTYNDLFLACLYKEPKTPQSLKLLIPIFFGQPGPYLLRRFEPEYADLRMQLRSQFHEFYKTWDDVAQDYRLYYLHATGEEFEKILSPQNRYLSKLIRTPENLESFYLESSDTTLMRYQQVNGRNVVYYTFEAGLYPIPVEGLRNLQAWLRVVHFPREFIAYAGSELKLLDFIQSAGDLNTVLHAIPDTEDKPALAAQFIVAYLTQVGNLEDQSAIEQHIGYVKTLGIALDPRKDRNTYVVGQPSESEYDNKVPRHVKAIAAVSTDSSHENLKSAMRYMLTRIGGLHDLALLCNTFEPYVFAHLTRDTFTELSTLMNNLSGAFTLSTTAGEKSLPEVYKQNMADKLLYHTLKTDPSKLGEVINWLTDFSMIGTLFAHRRVYISLFEELQRSADAQRITAYSLPGELSKALSIEAQAQVISEESTPDERIRLFNAWMVGNRTDAYWSVRNGDIIVRDLLIMLGTLSNAGVLQTMFTHPDDIKKLSFESSARGDVGIHGGGYEFDVMRKAVETVLSTASTSSSASTASADAAPQNGKTSPVVTPPVVKDAQLQRFEKQVEDSMRAMALPQAQRAGRRTTRFFSAAQPSLDLTLYTYGDHKLSYADYKKAAIEKLISDTAAAEAKKGERSNIAAK